MVYRARELELGRIVGPRILHAGLGGDPQLVERFRREAKAAGGLPHPAIVRVYQLGSAGGVHFISQEFVEGGSLAEWLHTQPRPAPRRAVEILLPVVEAVSSAHDRGILHRDLKPGNILLSSDGAPRLTDFGLARLSSLARMTRTGTMMGTPSYMAPEQIDGRRDEVGPWSDVYALGAILYTMLAGHPPFAGNGLEDLFRKVLRESAAPPSATSSRIVPRLDEICLACLAKKAQDRPANAGVLAKRLREYLDAARVASPGPPPPAPVQDGVRLPPGWTDLGRNAQGHRQARRPQDGGEMIWIPEGGFEMGSPADVADASVEADERPSRRVHVRGFWIDRCEVTWRQWDSFDRQAASPIRPERPEWAADDHPVVNVSWDEARAYCAWVGGDLPTEAQWERAARGAGGRRYPWGDDPPGAGHANRADRRALEHPTAWPWSTGSTRDAIDRSTTAGPSPPPPVRTPAARLPFGVLDLSGNVWEWCSDWYDAGAYGRGTDRDPVGPATGTTRVRRGGSWVDRPPGLRAADRYYLAPASRAAHIGFRCVVRPAP